MIPGPVNVKGVLSEVIPGGWKYAESNLILLAKLNPSMHFKVILGHHQSFGPIPKLLRAENIEILIETMKEKETPSEFRVSHSMQHGILLNYILKKRPGHTDYYLILDPDCYILKKNGIQIAIDRMLKFDLATYGVSYPSNLPKVYYTDFPTAYLQFIDSRKISPDQLDFRPSKTLSLKNKAPLELFLRLLSEFISFSKFPIKKLINRIKRSQNSIHFWFYLAFSNIAYRKFGLFKDTGWANRERFINYKYEIIPFRVTMVRIPSWIVSKKVSDLYSFKNQDLKNSGLNSAWHLIFNGIFENRDWSEFPFKFKLASKVLGNYNFSVGAHPAGNMSTEENTLWDKAKVIGPQNLVNSFEYLWEGDTYCIHLSHSGKTEPYMDSEFIRNLAVRLLKEEE